MPKYMLIAQTDDGETVTSFYDDYNKMEDARSSAAVSLGWYVEVYERLDTEFGREYVFIYA